MAAAEHPVSSQTVLQPHPTDGKKYQADIAQIGRAADS